MRVRKTREKIKRSRPHFSTSLPPKTHPEQTQSVPMSNFERKRYAPDTIGTNQFRDHDDLVAALQPVFKSRASTLYAMYIPLSVFGRNALGFWSPLESPIYAYLIPLLDLFRANVNRSELGMTTFSVLTVKGEGFFILMYEGVTGPQIAVNVAREIRAIPNSEELIAQAKAAVTARVPKNPAEQETRDRMFKIHQAVEAEHRALTRELRGISFTSWVRRFFSRPMGAPCTELSVSAMVTNFDAPNSHVAAWRTLLDSHMDTFNRYIKSYCLWSSGCAKSVYQTEYDLEVVFTLRRAYAMYATTCNDEGRVPTPFEAFFVEASVPTSPDASVASPSVNVWVPHPDMTPMVRVYGVSEVHTRNWSSYHFPHLRPSDESTIRESRNLASARPGVSAEVCRALIEETTGSSGLITSSSTRMFTIMKEVAGVIHTAMRIGDRTEMLRRLREATDAALGRIAEAVSVGIPSISPPFQRLVSYANATMFGASFPVPGAMDVNDANRSYQTITNDMSHSRREFTAQFEASRVFRTAFRVREVQLDRHRARERNKAMGENRIGLGVDLNGWSDLGKTCIIRGGLALSTESNAHMPGATLSLYNAISVVDLAASPFALPQTMAAVVLVASSGVYEDSRESGFHLGLFLPGEPGTGKSWLFGTISTVACVPDTCADLTTTSAKHGTSDTDNSYLCVMYDESFERIGGNHADIYNYTERAQLPNPSTPASNLGEAMLRSTMTSLVLTHARATVDRHSSGNSSVTDVSVTGCTPGFVIAAANVPSRLILPNAVQSRFIDVYCRKDTIAMGEVQLERSLGSGVDSSTAFGGIRHTYVAASCMSSQVLIAYNSVLVRAAVVPPLLPGASCIVLQLAARFTDEFGIRLDLGGRRQFILQRVAQTCALLRADGVVRSLGLLRPSRAPSVADSAILSAFSVVGYEDIFHALVATQALGDPVHVDVMKAIRDRLLHAIDEALLEVHAHVGMEMPPFSVFAPRNHREAAASISAPKPNIELEKFGLSELISRISEDARGLVTPDGYVKVTKNVARVGLAAVQSEDAHQYMGMRNGAPSQSGPSLMATTLHAFATELSAHPRLSQGRLEHNDIYNALFWALGNSAVATGSTTGAVAPRGPAIVVRDANVLVHLSMLVVCDFLSPLTIVGATLSPDVRAPVLYVGGSPCSGGYYTDICMLMPPSDHEVVDRVDRRNAVNKLCDRLAGRTHTPMTGDMAVPPMRAKTRKEVQFADADTLERLVMSNLAAVYPYVEKENLCRSIAYPPNTTVALAAAEDMRGWIMNMNVESAQDYSVLIDRLVAYYLSLYHTFDGLMYRVSEIDITSRISAIRTAVVESDDISRWATLALQRIQIAFVEHGDHMNHVKQTHPLITMAVYGRVHSAWMTSGLPLPAKNMIDTNDECLLVIDGVVYAPSNRRTADQMLVVSSYANWGQSDDIQPRDPDEQDMLPPIAKRRRTVSVQRVMSSASPSPPIRRSSAEEENDEDLFRPISSSPPRDNINSPAESHPVSAMQEDDYPSGVMEEGESEESERIAMDELMSRGEF